MRTITLTRTRANSTSASAPTYTMSFAVTAANDMTTHIFVKQRVGEDDTFVAVASPTQLEDLPENDPNEGESHFRSDTASLVASQEAVLEGIFETVSREVNLLIENLNALDNIDESSSFTYNGTTVVEN